MQMVTIANPQHAIKPTHITITFPNTQNKQLFKIKVRFASAEILLALHTYVNLRSPVLAIQLLPIVSISRSLLLQRKPILPLMVQHLNVYTNFSFIVGNF